MHTLLLLVLTITLTIRSSLTCSEKSLQAYQLMRNNNQGYKDILFSALAENQVTAESIQKQFLIGKDAKIMECLVKDPYVQNTIMNMIVQNPQVTNLCRDLSTFSNQLDLLRAVQSPTQEEKKHNLPTIKAIQKTRKILSQNLAFLATDEMLCSLESISLIHSSLASYPDVVKQSYKHFLRKLSPTVRNTIAKQFTSGKAQHALIQKIAYNEDVQALCDKIKQLKKEKQPEEKCKGYEQTLAWCVTEIVLTTLDYQESLK